MELNQEERSVEEVLNLSPPLAGSRLRAGKFLKPAGDLSFEQALDVFSEQAEALAEGGADMIAVDTFYDLEEAVAALRAVKSTTRLPVLVSFAFQPDPKGFHTMMGLSPEAAAIRLEQEGADIVGANCGGVTPEQMTSVVELMKRNCSKPICAKPNAGSPQVVEGKEVYRASPELLAERVPDWIKAGAKMVRETCKSFESASESRETLERFVSSYCPDLAGPTPDS